MPDTPLSPDHVCCQHLDLQLPPDRPLCHFDGRGDQYVKLNDRQRNGWACFYCGKEPTSLVPVGHTVTDPPMRLFACNSAACRGRAWLEVLTPCCAMGGAA